MQKALPEQSLPSTGQTPSDRLDSWKEIATHFRRDVRTVRRWEQTLALPVHRHRQQRGVAVYAYKSEVDEWWRQRDTTSSEAAQPKQTARRIGPLGWVPLGWVPVGWVVLALLGTLGLLRSGVWRASPPVGPPVSATDLVPLTSYPGVEEYPSLSPDAAQVAFSWNGEHRRNFDIYVRALDSSLADPFRLTSNAAADFSPAWSPDGRSIAFVREISPDELRIIVVPAVGGVEREIVACRAPWRREAGSYLSWTPKGEGLVFPHCETPGQAAALYLYSFENRQVRRLTSPPLGSWGDSGPAISPDGSKLAFARLKTLAVGDIHVLALAAGLTAAGEPRKLTSTGRGAANPAWTSSGREIVYLSDAGHEPRLERISVSGSGVAKPAGVGGLPAFSLAGRKLVFSRPSFDTNIWRIDLRRARRGKPSAASFIASTRDDSNADFCSHGEYIVYRSDRSGTPELWISDRDGANSRQLTSLAGPHLAGPRWAPDERRIAFAAWNDGCADIYTVHAAGGGLTPLAAGPAEDLWPNWSRDGRWVYFGSNRSGDWQVWKTPADGGPAVQITHDGGAAAMESLDGRFLYFTKGHGASSLWRIPIGGGPETLIVNDLFGPASFLVVADGVYFIANRAHGTAAAAQARGEYSIRFLLFATGESRGIARIGQPDDLGLAVSPDGRELLYPQRDQLEADLILQDFR